MKKSKWLFNIITVVLCVCAMAIGVYAAKQASLTANGQIGFKAHNCEVILNGTIDAYQSGGDIVLNKEQDIKTYTTTGGKITNIKIGGTGGVSTLTLPAMYFSDTGTNGNTVTLNLTTANQSVFDVKAKISVTGDMPTGVTYAISEDNYIMSATGVTGYSKSFTITFTLSNPTTSVDFGDTAFKIIMAFEKYVKPDIVSYLHRATSPNEDTGLEVGSLYVEMGEYNGTPLKWYAFAKSDENGAMQSFYKIDSLDNVQPGTYWFISEYALYRTEFNSTSKENQSIVDYNGSDLQKAMEGLKTNTTYKLYNSEVFDLITNRTLPGETYALYGIAGAGTTTGSTDQKFWALSYNTTDNGEWGLLSNHGESKNDELNCSTIALVFHSDYDWWLRSPCSYDNSYQANSYFVWGDGMVDYAGVGSEATMAFIRPAFQLEIV